MLFATEGNGAHEVPHVITHRPHGGLFVREPRDPDSHFACNRCGLPFRLRVTDGMCPTEAQIREALAGASPEEVVPNPHVHREEAAADRRALQSYAARERSDQAAETRRALIEIEALEMEEAYGEAVAGTRAVA
jgi:hypothetical protein